MQPIALNPRDTPPPSNRLAEVVPSLQPEAPSTAPSTFAAEASTVAPSADSEQVRYDPHGWGFPLLHDVDTIKRMRGIDSSFHKWRSVLLYALSIYEGLCKSG